MNDRTEQLEAIFHAASELATPGDRKRYLDEACRGDAALRLEVEALLEAATVGEELFQPVEQASPRLNDPRVEAVTECAGTLIGRYKLLERIGEGGMGVVYMAEQEQPVRRKVALKIIKPGMDTRSVIARFEAERQALALMDHPHIARVLDGGATETGRPYFVMELVQGVPITRFCDEHRLATEECLKLLIPVCQAIQSAHQKGIIHRDIKPSNVLVTMHNGVPHPMVIDFGVAKAIDQKLTEKTLFTNFATMIGTPAYMSPEQAEMSRLDVDTRSDIYSLGVLLYELLTGTTPFPEERLRSVAYGEMQRIIAEEEPESPSTRLRKKTAAPKSALRTPHFAIDPDLDSIVMRCLEKDRNRRYETANGLAADLKRHLENEPVVARPPGAVYRLQKLARRNKLKFAAATVALVAVCGGLAVSTWQAVRATRAEREALAVKDFLISQLLAANPDMETELDPNRRRLLQRVAEAAGSRFATQPLIEAEVRTAVGEAFFGLDDVATALEQFEKGLGIRRRLLGPMHSDTLWTLACAALAHQRLGRWNESESLLAEPLARVKAQGGPRSLGEAEVLAIHGNFLNKMGRFAEALTHQEQVLKVAARFSDHKSWRFQGKLQWQILQNIGAGRLKEADALSLARIREAEEHFGTNHPMTAHFYHARAFFLNMSGRYLEAVRFHEKIVPIRRRSIGSNHWYTVRAEYNLARTLEEAGEVERALNGYGNLHERLSAKLPLDWARQHLHHMGLFFISQRRFDLAQAAFRPLCEVYEINPPEGAAEFEAYIQAAAVTRGWPAAAEICRKHFDRFPDSLGSWLNKAWVFRYAGDEESYHRVVARVLAAPSSVVTTNEEHLPIEIAALGSLQFFPGQVDHLDETVSSLEAALPGRSTHQQVWSYRSIGLMQLRLGRFDRCLAALDQDALRQTNPEAYPLFIRAMCLHRLGRFPEARAAFDQAEALMKPVLALSDDEDRFLSPWQIYQQLLMHREAAALLGLK